MKKILLTALCLFSIAAFAQNGFFLQPSAGIGPGNLKQVDNIGTPTGLDNVLAYDGLVNIGYQYRHWVFNTGLGYMRTGSRRNLEILDSSGNIVSSSFRIYSYFYHFLLPIMAGYQFNLAKKFSITPSVGADISYNTSAKATEITYSGTGPLEKIPLTQFDENYKRISVFGHVQVGLDYCITSKVSITCSPMFDYMLTNMFKVSAGAPYTSIQHNYALLLNVGVKWQLTKRKKQPGKENVPGVK